MCAFIRIVVCTAGAAFGISSEVAPANAQSASFCVKEYFIQLSKDNLPLVSTATDVEELIQEVGFSIGLSHDVAVVPCEFAEKAMAWYAEEGAVPDVPSGEYIVYNPVWVREVIGKDKTQAIALFGHELGHFLNGHFTARKNLSSKEKETEADRFAGCAVARMEGDWATLEGLLSRLRPEESDLYPTQEESRNAARSGFDRCRAVPVSDDPTPLARFDTFYRRDPITYEALCGEGFLIVTGQCPSGGIPSYAGPFLRDGNEGWQCTFSNPTDAGSAAAICRQNK